MEFVTITQKPEFEISRDGTVRRKSNGRILKKQISTTGYYLIRFYTSSHVYKEIYLHRLLGQAFIPNPENKCDINHKDGNKLNYDLSNLEWATRSENLQHALNTGLRQPNRGETVHKSKLKNEDVYRIRQETSGTFSYQELAKKYGVCERTIYTIKARRFWKHLPEIA